MSKANELISVFSITQRYFSNDPLHEKQAILSNGDQETSSHGIQMSAAHSGKIQLTDRNTVNEPNNQPENSVIVIHHQTEDNRTAIDPITCVSI